MKTSINFLLSCLIILLLSSCSKEESEKKSFNEFNIYLTKDTIAKFDNEVDINSLSMDDEPYIKYDDIEWYDSAEQVMKIKYPVDTLFYPDNKMDMKGFVACIDTVRIFYGIFIRRIIRQ